MVFYLSGTLVPFVPCLARNAGHLPRTDAAFPFVVRHALFGALGLMFSTWISIPSANISIPSANIAARVGHMDIKSTSSRAGRRTRKPPFSGEKVAGRKRCF
jgi:hypothetical protein